MKKVSKEDVGEGGRQVGEAGQGGHRRGEGPQEGLLPGAWVCLQSVSIAPMAGGQWHLEGLSPLPGGRLGSYRRPLPLLASPPDSPHPTSLSHLPCPPCASPVGALGWTGCSPDSSSGAETPVMLIVVGEKSRQSPLGGWEVIQRGKGKYHLISCLPPHLSGPSQASVHGLSMLLSNWVPKKWEKIQVNAGSLDHSESQKTRPV